MLQSMRFQMVVRGEEEDMLVGLAFADRRPVRELANFLLLLKIRERWAARPACDDQPPVEPVA